MVDFLKRFYGVKFDPTSIIPYNAKFKNEHSDAFIRIVSDPNLPDLDADGKTVNLFFPKRYLLAGNNDFETIAYRETVDLLTSFHERWQIEKWNKNITSDTVLSTFQNFNRVHAGREWGAAMVTISCMIWYVTDDFFEEKLESISQNDGTIFSVELINDYITNLSELYRDYHLEAKPRKWLVFPTREDEKLWQWLWDVHCDYLEHSWNTFTSKIQANSPTWYEIFRDSYIRYFAGWQLETDFTIRINNHPTGDFPDRYWKEVRSICQACYVLAANILPWDWKHGPVNFTHWSCLEIDNWAALQNDIMSFAKEKVAQCPTNIIFREWKRLGASGTDSEAIAYGVGKAKYLMLEVLNHSSDSHMNKKEKAFIDEYIRFMAVLSNHFLVMGRYGWKIVLDD